MKSEIRINDISEYIFLYNQKFCITDDIKNSINDISKWLKDITISFFIQPFQFLSSLNNSWYL